jgi:transforming growth factor-beta-induced protein
MKNFIQVMNMKNLAAYAILLVALPFFITSCSDDDDDDDMNNSQNIVEIAQQTPDLSTLVDAVIAADLVDALSGDGPFTVFAPTNAAFAALDQDDLNNIIGNPVALRALLQYHVVGAELFSDDLFNGDVQTLLSGQTILVNTDGGVTLNETSNVTQADIDASNGVIHIIDEVLFPEEFYSRTIAQIAASDDRFTTLVAALSKPELSDLLAAANNPSADLTVFAPTNDAFDATLAVLGKESIDDIPVDLLYEIVSYHILPQAVLSNQLVDGVEEQTLLAGETVVVDLTDGVKINDSNVIIPDVRAINGVIHAIDGVLLPSYVLASLGTIAEVVLFEKDFTILAAALRKAELLSAVSDRNADLTVFAPDNAAFVKAGFTSLDNLEKDDLTPILTYHVLGQRVLSSQLPASGIAETLNGNIYLGYMLNGGVLINGFTNIKLDMIDIIKDNGVIHVIDRTLVPPALDIVDIAVALAGDDENSEFTVLVSLLTDPAYEDIAQAIKDQGNITVFAPTDAAFNDIADLLPTLTPEQVRTVLTYHATPARAFSYDLVTGQNINMLAGQTLNVVSANDNGVVLQDKSNATTNVIIANVHGRNGVIHAIDKVLIPNL